jgi:hypothetical protein
MKYCIDCSKNNINKIATYGNIDENESKYCSPCSKNKKEKLVNFKHGYCQQIINNNKILLSDTLCGKNANFNYINSEFKKGIRCNEHKEENMICINGHLCKECKIKQASFKLNNSITKTPTHCASCIIKYNNVKNNIVHKKCINCKDKTALYGIKDSNIKTYCKECSNKLNLEVFDLHHKKCILCNIKTALYNNKNDIPMYCNDCKDTNMILIYKKKCEKCNDITPVYNYPQFKKGIFCQKCSEKGMINVKDRLCEKCNIKRPSFNIKTENIPKFCNDCKTNNMINIFSDICEIDNCDKISRYNFNDCDKPKYCKDHALPNMKILIGSICNECDRYATFNYINETKRLYCSKHAKDGMIDIIHNKKCIVCNEKRALYNNYGEKIQLYCFNHKTDLMVNLDHKLCNTYLCGKRSIEKYEDYCLTCYIYKYPDKPLSRNYKTKENIVVKFILNKFSNFTWITDKIISDGCSSKRPDLLLDLGYQVINIEIDENQHKSYEEICENKRIMMISKDINHRNLILIRFNPDGYTMNLSIDKELHSSTNLKENTKIDTIHNIKKLSCWNINKENGLCTIKKTYQKEWDLRLQKLEETIKYWINPNNISDKLINIIHLFFDE